MKRTRSEVAALAQAERLKSQALARDGWSPEVWAEVLARYAAGQSGEVIAESMGLTHAGVYRLLRKEGVLRPRGAVKRIGERGRPQIKAEPGVTEVLPADVAEQAVARYQAGEPPRVIGLALGVPASRVYRLLHERGVVRSKSAARKMQYARRRAEQEERQGRLAG